MTIQQFFRPGEGLCKEPLHYTDSGLDNIYLSNGFEFEEDGGERYLSVTDIDGLHRAIGMHIALARKAPSGKELRFLRTEMDMSQADVARVLGVTDQSVARWEKGQTEPNGPAVFSIRVLYLLSLLPADERERLFGNLVKRLENLSERDETSDEIVLSYCGDKWYDRALAA